MIENIVFVFGVGASVFFVVLFFLKLLEIASFLAITTRGVTQIAVKMDSLEKKLDEIKNELEEIRQK